MIALVPAHWAGASPHLTAVVSPAAYQKAGMTTWNQASVGDALGAGDQVRTGVQGAATIVFDDDSRIELGANSTFQVNEVETGKTSVRLSLGFLRALVSKIASRQFNVRTPTAVCSVRGTEFTVDVNAQGHTSVQMFAGVLAVADGLGNEALVKDKQSVRVTDKGLQPVSGAEAKPQTKAAQRADKLRELAKREVGFEISKEAVQSAAAAEAKKAVYEQGKAIIDVNGNRVRIEEYIIRPTPTDFKLVVLNERVDSFNFFWYHGTFNTVLPGDLSIALRQLTGCS